MKKEKFITEIIEIAENAGIEFDQLDEEEPPMSNTKFARKMFELATEAAKTFFQMKLTNSTDVFVYPFKTITTKEKL